MNEQLLPMAVWVQVAYVEVRRRTWHEWTTRQEEDGVDEAVTKMIWLAVGIVVAIAATTFFMAKFNQAKDNVPDPIVL
jgi:heme/copper-type cytochrome/quinol oxidase subunit 2